MLESTNVIMGGVFAGSLNKHSSERKHQDSIVRNRSLAEFFSRIMKTAIVSCSQCYRATGVIMCT